MPKALWSDKRKFIWVLTLVLMSAFFLTSRSSYQVAHHSLSEQIESNTLPLTSDNIYSEIQQDLLRPIFISSLILTIPSYERGVARLLRYDRHP